MNSKSREGRERVTSRATDLSPIINEQRTTDSKATDLSPTLENKKDN